MKCLLIDFGASRIKTALYDSNKKKFSHLIDFSPCPNIAKRPGYFEVSPNALSALTKKIIRSYQGPKSFEKIFFCTEMHGFLLVDKETLKPLSNYISWQDERADEKINNLSTLEWLPQDVEINFKKITGSSVRIGLPFITLCHLGREKKLPSSALLLSLADWVFFSQVGKIKYSHPTSLAGLGFFSVSEQVPSADLFYFFKNAFGSSLETLSVSESDHYFERLGKSSNQEMNIGYGDHQTALWGSELEANQISVNMGTGSQVSILGDHSLKSPQNFLFDVRPYFNKKTLNTFTHIPSGRALNHFLKIFGTSPETLWKKIKLLKEKDLEEASLQFNLTTFKSARGFSKTGSIQGIQENNFTQQNFLASLIRNYLDQYLMYIDHFKRDFEITNLKLSGGIPSKIPVLSKYLKQKTGLEIKTQKLTHDETLMGLASLAHP